MIRKGFMLLGIWACYELLSFLYFDQLWASAVAMQLGILLGIGFLAMWFLYSYKLKLGWSGGLVVGMIGASLGLLSLLVSLAILLTSGTREGGPFWIMLPWSYPLFSLMNYLPFKSELSNFVPHLSVLLSVVLSGLGGWIGARDKTKVSV